MSKQIAFTFMLKLFRILLAAQTFHLPEKSENTLQEIGLLISSL